MSHHDDPLREDAFREDAFREDLSEHVLPRFSLERRITVLALLATIFVVGAIATLGIPLELVPRGFDEPSLQVQAFWQDAPAQELLDKSSCRSRKSSRPSPASKTSSRSPPPASAAASSASRSAPTWT
jgi:hypothetical protein